MSRRNHRGRSDAAHVVPGERAVLELLRACPERVQALLVLRERKSGPVEVAAERAGITVRRVDRKELEVHAPESLARGVLALAEAPPELDIDDLIARALDAENGLLVALDGVVDPRNLGAILRSAEFFGAHGLFRAVDRSAKLGPAAVKASAGATERVPQATVVNLVRALERCKDAGLWVVGSVVDGGVPVEELTAQGRVPRPMVLVMGNEERGIRRLVREKCDFLATIGRQGALGSLNVSAAAAVLLSEFARDASDSSRD